MVRGMDTAMERGMETASGMKTAVISVMGIDVVCLFGWLVGFLMSSSTTRLYRGRAPRQSV